MLEMRDSLQLSWWRMASTRHEQAFTSQAAAFGKDEPPC